MCEVSFILGVVARTLYAKKPLHFPIYFIACLRLWLWIFAVDFKELLTYYANFQSHSAKLSSFCEVGTTSSLLESSQFGAQD